MNASPSDIGSNKHFNLAVTEIFQCTQTFVLRNLARHQRGLDTVLAKTVSQSTRFMTAITENDCTLNTINTQIITQQLVFILTGDQEYFLSNVVSRLVLGLDLDCDRILSPLLRQTHNIIGEGCAVQQGLTISTLARSLADDGTHIRNKAHAEHTVRFIQYQHFYLIQIHFFGADKIDQAPWRCYQNIDRLFSQGFTLTLIVHASHK